MAYTYDDFWRRAQESGYADQFSASDLALAQRYPDFGMSILSLKQDYNNATTDQARALAHEAANQLRGSYGAYNGNESGLGYSSLGLGPNSYQSQYRSAADDIFGQMRDYGGFSYDRDAPTYDNRYGAMIDEALAKMNNRGPFEYNPDTDINTQAYRKEYAREGQRATANAMAQAAAQSGGVPSTAAMTAASQAGDYYAAQMADKIPELYQAAYERYLNEFANDRANIGTLQNQQQLDYNQYRDALQQYNTDRALAYNQWQDQYNMLANQLSAAQGLDNTDYSRLLDQINWVQDRQDARDAEAATAQSDARAQVDAMLQAGGNPSADLVSAAGYPQEYVDAMRSYYAQQAAARYSGGGGSRTSATAGANEQLFEDAYASGMPISAFLALYGDQYGIKSSNYSSISNAYNDWKAWRTGDTGATQDQGSVFRQIKQSGMDPYDWALTTGYSGNISDLASAYRRWDQSGGYEEVNPIRTETSTQSAGGGYGSPTMVAEMLRAAPDNATKVNILMQASLQGMSDAQIAALAQQFGVQLVYS